MTSEPTANPRPSVYIMAKPAGAHCNMRCSYCYYLEKEKLKHDPAASLMDETTLENYIRQYVGINAGGVANFIWHGGESLLPGPDFYHKVIEIQAKYAASATIVNTIQTNGTLLNDEWCKFFKDNDWLVGVSIDGPERVHDAFRRFGNGKASFAKVMAGIELLNRYEVEWNAMAVVNSLNVLAPLDFYNFFKSIGCRFLQFTPVVERRTETGRLATYNQGGTLTPESVTPDQWGNFLCMIFDNWVRNDVGRMFIQLFDATLANWLGAMPGLCSVSASCGHAGVLELNGDIYSCDHFVFPEYKLGNINSSNLAEIMSTPRQMSFSRLKLDGLSEKCRRCRFLFACHGECPKNRFANSGDEPHNYLCDGYKRFFSHAEPYMNFMAEQYRAGRSPANVMKCL